VSPGPGPAERATVPIERPAPPADAGTERAALVELCIDLADRLRETGPALRTRLHRGLAEVGVIPLEPDGSPFDRGRHDAVDREPTDDPARDRTVASTELTGYLDRGRVLRRPGVVVYALEEVRDDDRHDTAR